MADEAMRAALNAHREVVRAQQFDEVLTDCCNLDNREGLGGQEDADDLGPAPYDDHFHRTPGEWGSRHFPELGDSDEGRNVSFL